MKLGMLFAGQGSQFVGMGEDFYEHSPAFRKVFNLLLDQQKNLAFHGPAEELCRTKNTQPIMVAFALGVYEILKEQGIKPAIAAGLSLGEYSALAVAGVWNPRTALELVSFRGEEMEKAAEGVDTVMSAVLGLSASEVEKACAEGSRAGIVEVANYNCPGQVVLSGTQEGVEAAEHAAMELGARRCMRLAVSGPFHTSYMKPAGQALEAKFRQVAFGDMAFPVLFNCLGREKDPEESVQNLLVRQVSSSVRMEDIIRQMEASGVTHIIEVGPGKALAGFVRKTSKSLQVTSIERWEDIEKVMKWIEE